MGCTPSKAKRAYSQDRVCKDFDTCSTFVSGLKTSSTPERPTQREQSDTPEARAAFLSVPKNDFHKCSVIHLPSTVPQNTQERTPSCSRENLKDNDSADDKESVAH